MNIEEIMVSPLLTDETWKEKANGLYQEVMELYVFFAQHCTCTEERAKIINRPQSKTYYDEHNQVVMRSDFEKITGDLETVRIYTDKAGNRKKTLTDDSLLLLHPTFSAEQRLDSTDLMHFQHLSITDFREGTDIHRLDLDVTPNGELQISVHELKLNYNGKEVKAFYKTDGILSAGFSSGFNMLTMAKITMLENKYNN